MAADRPKSNQSRRRGASPRNSQRTQTQRTQRTQRTRGAARRRPAYPGTRSTAPRRAGAAARNRRNGEPLRMPLASGAKRINVILLVMAIVVSLFAGRLLQLQGFDSKAYANTASKQMTRTMPLPAMRGTVTDRNGLQLATTEEAVAITADPTLTGPKADQIAGMLVAHIGGRAEDYKPALTKPDTRYSIVAKKVPAARYHRLASDLSDQGIYGIFRESDPIRSYPEGSTAAAVVGFVGADGKGQGGLEYSMNSELAGTAGKEMFESSPAGYRIPLGQNVIDPATNGVNYQLTLDTELQSMAEKKLDEAVKEAKAKSGSVVTMNVKTGEVLAMANMPTFDANNTAEARSEDLFNRTVTQAYEPGSVQKVLTMAALMDSGTATPETKLQVPPTLDSGGGKIKDVWSHGYARVTARGVVTFSSNIGTIMLTRQMDKAKYREYLASFGLGKPTGIELPGEASGYLPPADMSDATRDQIAFGQGLSVTAVQNAAALAGVLNGGMYNKPTIIKSATDPQGNPVPIEREAPRRVISPEASDQVASMMESVLGPDGFAKHLNMKDYRVGGKTGTSENYDAELGKYSGYTVSFAGMVPADDPQILTYVVIDRPLNGDTGGAVAGPVWWDVTRLAIPRYGVLPSTSQPPSGGLEW